MQGRADAAQGRVGCSPARSCHFASAGSSPRRTPARTGRNLANIEPAPRSAAPAERTGLSVRSRYRGPASRRLAASNRFDSH
ncbi:hypothetical protein [Lysobacter gummosus]|uniref:hypothetical protein n=1 Tax=Lysobacter gummosus TaxID=262324 RepID=UPI00362701C8